MPDNLPNDPYFTIITITRKIALTSNIKTSCGIKIYHYAQFMKIFFFLSFPFFLQTPKKNQWDLDKLEKRVHKNLMRFKKIKFNAPELTQTLVSQVGGSSPRIALLRRIWGCCWMRSST